MAEGERPADGTDPEFEELEKELRQANEEYLDALSVAGQYKKCLAAIVVCAE